MITLCGDANDKCSIINIDKHIYWDIPDPAKSRGNENEIALKFSKVRNIIYNNIILLKETLNKY